eukprot:356868-Chlamydomonas_euryale.AAC.7
MVQFNDSNTAPLYCAVLLAEHWPLPRKGIAMEGLSFEFGSYDDADRLAGSAVETLIQVTSCTLLGYAKKPKRAVREMALTRDAPSWRSASALARSQSLRCAAWARLVLPRTQAILNEKNSPEILGYERDVVANLQAAVARQVRCAVDERHARCMPCAAPSIEPDRETSAPPTDGVGQTPADAPAV